MKRKNNLYENMCNITNIISAFNEVCKNTQNKKKVTRFREYKCMYIASIHKTLTERSYIPGPYNVFMIHDPKTRRIVSQRMEDKVINHLVSRHILYPAILPCLLDVNVASRQNLGTSEGIRLSLEFHRICKVKYKNYYILKCDISKFFASIDHDILKKKVLKRIKDKEALDIIFTIIDNEKTGLSIGAMSSQVLAIYYLNDMDHFIKEKLKIKHFIRYQDDFLLFHPSKNYLRYCLEELKKFLSAEKLSLNSKTKIYSSNSNFVFLGKNVKGHYVRYRNVKRKLRKRYYLYQKDEIPLNSLLSSISCYNSLCRRKIKFIKGSN